MAYFLVDNFSAGLDLRRGAELAPAGSLRTLENAFVNEGGEVEKRKAFVLDEELTAYLQSANYKERATGPHPIPGYPEAVYFRHRHDSLPGGDWAAGGGGQAALLSRGEGLAERRVWAMKSTAALPDFGALMHARSVGEFNSAGHVLEAYFSLTGDRYRTQQIEVEFDEDQPTGETAVAANADRSFMLVLDGKGYFVENRTLFASAVGDPTDMAGTGSAAFPLTTQGSSIGRALSLGEYFGQLAVFGRRGVMFFDVAADPDATNYRRHVSASLFAPRTVLGYGDGDVLFLSRTGVRSLRARDSSNLARVDDIGSPIDSIVRDQLAYNAEVAEPVILPTDPDRPVSEFLTLATASVIQDTGQAWMAVGDRIYVLTRHPAAGVQAWATFALPIPANARLPETTGRMKARWIADMAQIGETIMFRTFADEVFVYGGLNVDQYDETPAVVELPFADMGRPGDNKNVRGIDVVCTGTWDVEVSLVPDAEGNPTHWFTVAQVTGSTRPLDRIPLDVTGKQIAVRLTTADPQDARLRQVGIYYSGGAEK